MSRIANNPIKISKEVECTFKDGIFSAKGKLGQMQTTINSNFDININEEEIKVISDQVGNFTSADTLANFIWNIIIYK